MANSIRHTLTIPNNTAHLAAVRELVSELILRSAYPAKRDASAITLAVDEAIANIIEHAYRHGEDERMEIQIELCVDKECFSITLRDQGEPFEPDDVEKPDMELHVREGRKHGLGLFLIRSIMDTVDYTFVKDGWNEMRMVRFAQRKPG